MKTCNEVMTPNPACCVGKDTVEQAAMLMKNEHVGPIPVVEDEDSKKLIGIVTDRDLVLKVIAAHKDPYMTRVDEVMTRDPISCHPQDDLTDAMEAMSVNQVRRIPVVDDNHCVIGIISQADVAIRNDSMKKTAEVVMGISQPTLSENPK